MKGIILSGGYGSRLYPATASVSKQLIPVFDKPLIYYPLCTLIYAGINEILCITSIEDNNSFKKLLGNGNSIGLNIQYAIQKKPNGIAESFLIAEQFIANDNVALILGDNIFYGIENEPTIDFSNFKTGARVFAYQVPDPSRYGVIEFNNKNIVSIEEKPRKPKSKLAVTGLYYYDNKVINIAKNIKPSKRNELEITDVNNSYINMKNLEFTKLKNNVVWLDAGTPTSLLQASQFVQTIQERQQTNICCPEEAAFKKGFISLNQLENIVGSYPNNGYGNYLKNIVIEYKNN
jgi:glucose-1-phosphate thymidylyltransferase|tara:strand:- start:8049 stop:8921 length:873 start_codon:yes stop_codon:yes gene_type:complete